MSKLHGVYHYQPLTPLPPCVRIYESDMPTCACEIGDMEIHIPWGSKEEEKETLTQLLSMTASSRPKFVDPKPVTSENQISEGAERVYV